MIGGMTMLSTWLKPLTRTVSLFLIACLVLPSVCLAEDNAASEGVDAYMQGKLDVAIKLLEKAMASGQGGDKAKAYLIKAYTERAYQAYTAEDFKKAKTLLDAALKIDPENK